MHLFAWAGQFVTVCLHSNIPSDFCGRGPVERSNPFVSASPAAGPIPLIPAIHKDSSPRGLECRRDRAGAKQKRREGEPVLLLESPSDSTIRARRSRFTAWSHLGRLVWGILAANGTGLKR
jgi:hypothetical protein